MKKKQKEKPSVTKDWQGLADYLGCSVDDVLKLQSCFKSALPRSCLFCGATNCGARELQLYADGPWHPICAICANKREDSASQIDRIKKALEWYIANDGRDDSLMRDVIKELFHANDDNKD